MKRLFLSVLACMTLFAMTSCNPNDDGGADANAWIYGTWLAVEIYVEGGVNGDDSEDPASIAELNSTISFDATGKAVVDIPAFSERVEHFTKAYDYSISGNAIKVGEYDLTYEFVNEQLKIYGKGEFVLNDLLPFWESGLVTRTDTDLLVTFTFDKLPKVE